MSAYLSLIGGGGGGGGRLFEVGRLLTFWTLRVGAYSRWALVRCWALIKFSPFQQVKYVYFATKQ